MHNMDDYANTLLRRLAMLQENVAETQAKVRELSESIREKEEQIEYIHKLLAAEGISLDGYNASPSVADIAYEYLANQPEQTPIHYRELAEQLLALGHVIPGQNPAANLLSYLSRDNRFVRTGRGVYALVEWRLSQRLRPSQRHRKKRKRQSKR